MDIDSVPWGRYRLTTVDRWNGPHPGIMCTECYRLVDLDCGLGMDDAVTEVIGHEEREHAS